ncbi:MAG: F0F1 ATP synthase subunit delta, partial [Candidatus Rokuibacteriota bacterium]
MRAREGTARRYARALHDLARERGQTEAVGREIGQVAAVFSNDARARDPLTQPWIKPEDRRAVASAIAQKVGAGKLVQDFAGLVSERGR